MENKGIVESVYESFSRGDLSSIVGLFASDIQYQMANNFPYGGGKPFVGPKAVIEGVFQRMGSEVEGMSAAPKRAIDGGDTIVVEGRYSGKIKATGKAIDAQFVHVWQLAAGKIIRFQQYTDTKGWSVATGT